MAMTWNEAVKAALMRYSRHNKTAVINRQSFLHQELKNIINDTSSLGRTPSQTTSRVLQELRDEGYLFFSNISGEYILNQVAINASSESLPDDFLDNAIDKGPLLLDDVSTSTDSQTKLIRKGMGALRRRTLINYQNCCALCEIDDERLLVTSHIARWSDNPAARGLLTNTICFCTLHDKLFENGYFALSENTNVIWKFAPLSHPITIWKTHCTSIFKLPQFKRPEPKYLTEHRIRVNL